MIEVTVGSCDSGNKRTATFTVKLDGDDTPMCTEGATGGVAVPNPAREYSTASSTAGVLAVFVGVGGAVV